MASLEDVYLVPGLGHVLQSYMGLKDRLSAQLVSKDMQTHYPTERKIDVDSFSDDPKIVAQYLSTRCQDIQELTMTTNRHGLVLPPTLNTMPNVKKITYAIPLYIATETKSIEYTTLQYWQSVERLLDVLLTTDHIVEEFNVIPGDIIFRTTVAKNTYEDVPLNILSPGVHNSLYTRLRNYPLVREPVGTPMQTSLKKVRICVSMLNPKVSFYLRKFTTVSDWGYADSGDMFPLNYF